MMIRKAKPEEFQAVRAFYHAVTDGIAGTDNSAGWIRDVYPAPEYLQASIRGGELWLAGEDGRIISAMVLNHAYNEEYRKFRWPTEAEDAEVTVIHALGVLPACMGKGVARQMVRFAIDFARENLQKAIRLDVLKGNVRAEKLYAGMGFRYLHTLPMYYEDTGWTDFELYEYRL